MVGVSLLRSQYSLVEIHIGQSEFISLNICFSFPSLPAGHGQIALSDAILCGSIIISCSVLLIDYTKTVCVCVRLMPLGDNNLNSRWVTVAASLC